MCRGNKRRSPTEGSVDIDDGHDSRSWSGSPFWWQFVLRKQKVDYNSVTYFTVLKWSTSWMLSVVKLWIWRTVHMSKFHLLYLILIVGGVVVHITIVHNRHRIFLLHCSLGSAKCRKGWYGELLFCGDTRPSIASCCSEPV